MHDGREKDDGLRESRLEKDRRLSVGLLEEHKGRLREWVLHEGILEERGR